MAIETGSVFIGLMAAAHLGPMLIRMALQTETIGAHDHQMFIFTGMGFMAFAALTLHNRFMDTNSLFIDGLMTRGAKGIGFSGRPQGSALTGIMAGGAFATGHGSMNIGLKQTRPGRTMGGMAAYTGAVGSMTEMGLAEVFSLAVMATETQGIGLLNQQLRLPGIMGIMTGSTAILKRGMNILPFKALPVVTLVAGLIHRLLQQMILGSIMTGMTFSALPLFHRLMDRYIGHCRGQFPVTAKAETRRFLAQKNTADDPMGKMAGPAGVFRHRLMDIALLKSSCHVDMTILTSLAYGLTGLLLHTGSQSADQEKQDNKLTYFP